MSNQTVAGLRSAGLPPARRCCSSCLPRSAVMNSDAILDAGWRAASCGGQPWAARVLRPALAQRS